MEAERQAVTDPLRAQEAVIFLLPGFPLPKLGIFHHNSNFKKSLTKIFGQFV